MENASKALIIAGAILLSILIISIGIYIYNNSMNSTKSIVASKELEMELQQYNKQYEMYEGIQNSNNIKALLNIVAQNNMNLCKDDKNRDLCVSIKSKSKKILSKVTDPYVRQALTVGLNGGGVQWTSNVKKISNFVGENEKYNISMEYNKNGYVYEIWINDID